MLILSLTLSHIDITFQEYLRFTLDSLTLWHY